MYDNYCKKLVNGEIYKIDYFVVWFMDDIKVDIFFLKLV